VSDVSFLSDGVFSGMMMVIFLWLMVMLVVLLVVYFCGRCLVN